MSESNEISHLYKYRSLDGACLHWVLDTLANNNLRFSSVKEFNDPFDCLPIYSFDAPPDLLKKYAKGVVSRRSQGASRNERRGMIRVATDPSRTSEWVARVSAEMRENIESKAGIYCLSEVPDNILMWGHYADSHRGVALRFRATASTPFFGRAQRVVYRESRPVVNPIPQSYDEQTEAALLSKAQDWAYEKEWRIIDHDNGPGVQRFAPELLDGVILGARISSESEERIRAAVSQRSPATQLFKARLDGAAFRVLIKPC